MRRIFNRPRVDIRPRRQPFSAVKVEGARDRARLEASLPRISL